MLDKIFLPQNSLYENREEFIDIFFREGGYVEACIDECTSPCIFGLVELDG